MSENTNVDSDELRNDIVLLARSLIKELNNIFPDVEWGVVILACKIDSEANMAHGRNFVALDGKQTNNDDVIASFVTGMHRATEQIQQYLSGVGRGGSTH